MLTASLALFATFSISLSVKANTSDYHNGSYGEGSFENKWQDDLSYAWAGSDWFRAQVNNNTSTRFGTYNLHGSAQPGRWHSSCDECSSGGLETVDIVYFGTHGGAFDKSVTHTNPRAVWAMGDAGTLAESTKMWLGNEDDQLQILAIKSCETMSLTEPNESHMWKRWDSVFNGGLYVALASHDTMYFGYYERKAGEKFAEELQGGAKLRYAWKDGNALWNNNQDVMALFASDSETDCSNRRSGMTWSNTASYGRVRDPDVDYWCSTLWDDV